MSKLDIRGLSPGETMLGGPGDADAPGRGAPEGFPTFPAALALGGLVLCLVVATGWLGGGPTSAGIPRLVWIALAVLFIQWLAFLPAYRAATEHYYDLVGSLTYVGAILAGLAAPRPVDAFAPRRVLVTGLVLVWAIRLGSFLFARVRARGKDGRFDAIKTSASRFFIAWTLQGLWITWTVSAALILVVSPSSATWGPADLVGTALWLGGFGIEAVADRQKRAFRAAPTNADRWIETGLWAWSRHPNYLGEIVLWTGIAVIGAGVFRGTQWIGLVSPVFVALLLTRGSGIPLLEDRADARWGKDPAYQDYKRRTPVLVPVIG